ncbi:MAG: hypothetical protein J6Y14_01190 [Fibrobacter sp.]|nr:hypothetical protein [Fibrobacter sp.]
MNNPSMIRYAISAIIFAMGNIALVACGGDSKSSSPESSRNVSTIYDLGACTKDRDGDTLFVKDKSIDYLCVGGNWIDITTQNVDTTTSESPNVEPKEVETIYELGACNEKREGVRILVVESGMGYVCRSEQWQQMVSRSSSSVGGKNESSSSSSRLSSSSVSVDDPVCRDCKSSSSAKLTYIEVKSKDQLGTCDSKNLDMRALVLADSTYYTCKAKGWNRDTDYLGYEIVSARVDLPNCNEGNAKQRILVKKDSVFFVCDTGIWTPETSNGYVINNISVMGSAHKGPFKFNSPLELREVLLRNDTLLYSGRKYIDEISSNAGDFVIPKVRMIYPYAVLEVRGLWRNEVTGEWSKDTMTLRALTELTDKVNVNLLTHLEYDRAVNLIKKGYSVSAAKTQADYEIMTAFEITPTMSNSEAKETFGSGADPTLLAMATLFIGNRSDSEINRTINSFKTDIADDGVWDDEKTKAEMADWAESFDYSVVRANVKSWNITAIPEFEAQLRTFWYNAYGLGGCGQNRYEVVAPVTNAQSANYNVHYICKSSGWQKATDIEKDTYQWTKGDEGQVKKGDVTDTYYVYENGKWTIAKNENALGICTAKRKGEVGKVDLTYFICEDDCWRKATVLEYDTDGFGKGDVGEVRTGKVNKDKFYVYENGAWRASANEIENDIGACVTSRLNEVSKSGNSYYTCKSDGWTKSSALEYDTYGWKAGTEGEVKEGSVVATNHYVYENGVWRETADEIEYECGACVENSEGRKCAIDGIYSICKSNVWKTVSVFEFDTYGKVCIEDGAIVNGESNKENKYVCDADTFRVAEEREVYLDKGCVKFNWDEEIRIQIAEDQDSVYTCGISYTGINTYSNQWSGSKGNHFIYGPLLIDERDGRSYKSVVIGNQIWMAENLKYDMAGSYADTCIKAKNNHAISCLELFGRYYTWSAAKKACPEGWHLPDTTEFRELVNASGGWENLKSKTSWGSKTADLGYVTNNGVDAYGFNAYATGWYSVKEPYHFTCYGIEAEFWSSSGSSFDGGTHGGVFASCYHTHNEGPSACRVEDGLSVRCIKD